MSDKREPVVGDRVRNKQTDGLGRIVQVDHTPNTGYLSFLVQPDEDVDSSPDAYWEAIWNLEIVS